MGEKRQLTPEQLEKLKLAREKALAVRQAKAEKMKEIKRLEKEAAEQEINTTLETLKKASPAPAVEVQESDPEPPVVNKKAVAKAVAKKPKRSKEEIVRSVVEEESEDSDSDEEESVVHPVKAFLKEKYKQKYKQKYESKHLNNLVKQSAHNHLRSKIDEEVFRLAQQSMFS
jgi:hypothetical protein